MSSVTVEDEYDEYNYDQDKLVNSGHSGNIFTIEIIFLISAHFTEQCMINVFFFHSSGKNRSKKEASEHTNHFDPSGHSRKISTKLHNAETNKKDENLKPHPSTRK